MAVADTACYQDMQQPGDCWQRKGRIRLSVLLHTPVVSLVGVAAVESNTIVEAAAAAVAATAMPEVPEGVGIQGSASCWPQNSDGTHAGLREPGPLIAVAVSPVASPKSADMALPPPAAGKIGLGSLPGFVVPEQNRSRAVLLVQELKQGCLGRPHLDVMVAVTR